MKVHRHATLVAKESTECFVNSVYLNAIGIQSDLGILVKESLKAKMEGQLAFRKPNCMLVYFKLVSVQE